MAMAVSGPFVAPCAGDTVEDHLTLSLHGPDHVFRATYTCYSWLGSVPWASRREFRLASQSHVTERRGRGNRAGQGASRRLALKSSLSPKSCRTKRAWGDEPTAYRHPVPLGFQGRDGFLVIPPHRDQHRQRITSPSLFPRHGSPPSRR
jgi:hypothetical protein